MDRAKAGGNVSDFALGRPNIARLEGVIEQNKARLQAAPQETSREIESKV